MANSALTGLGGGAAAEDVLLDMFGAADTAHEFETTSLTGLTLLSTGAPDVEDANTSVPGCYYIRESNNATDFYGRYFAAPTAPWTAILHVLDQNVYANYNWANIFVGEATPGALDVFGVANGSRIIAGEKYNSPTSPNSTWLSGVGFYESQVFLAIRANSATDVDYLHSSNGRIWRKDADSRNPGHTLGSIGFSIKSQDALMAAAFECIRVWESALTLPGALA